MLPIDCVGSASAMGVHVVPLSHERLTPPMPAPAKEHVASTATASMRPDT